MAQQPQVEVMGTRKTNWWLVVAGVVLVLFAAATFLAPYLFLEFITIASGVAFLFSGVMGIGSYFKVRGLPNAGWSLLMAILDALVGIMMLLHPIAFAPVLPWILGASFIMFGVLEVGATIPLGSLIPESRGMAIVSGVLTVIVGIMFIVWPESLSIWVAMFSLIRGITLVVAGFTSRVE